MENIAVYTIMSGNPAKMWLLGKKTESNKFKLADLDSFPENGEISKDKIFYAEKSYTFTLALKEELG